MSQPVSESSATKRWGITLPLPGVPLAAHRDLVRELPDLGYTDVWSAETAGTDAFTPLAAWAAGDRAGANAAIPDEVVDDLVVHGPVVKCRERIAEYVAQGLDTPVTALLPTDGDPLDMVRKLAPS